MNPRPPLTVAPKPESASLVWVVASIATALAFVLFVAHSATLLRIEIPAGTACVGLALYLRRPIGYIHFTLWTWFLAPFVRRLVDWKLGFQDQNLVLLAPFLVTSIAGLTLLRERHRAARLQLAPFMLCLAGILYAFLVGITRMLLHAEGSVPLAASVYGLITWAATLLFGLHFYLRWPMYEEHSRAIQKSFAFAVLLLGLYGIVQYVVAPPWDTAWLEGVSANGLTFGRPQPYAIRVFSTMNAPGVFGQVLQTGLILLFLAKIPYKAFVNAAGYLALLLTLIRTDWLSLIIGLLLVITSAGRSNVRSAVVGLVLISSCLIPIALVPQFKQVIQDRLSTFNDIKEDQSFRDRSSLYQSIATSLFESPAGTGIIQDREISAVRSGLDSGLLQIPIKLGITGGALFIAGIVAAIWSMLEGWTTYGGETSAYRAICLALLGQLISGNVFISVGGLCYWMFFGLWLSSKANLQLAAMETGTLSQHGQICRPMSCS